MLLGFFCLFVSSKWSSGRGGGRGRSRCLLAVSTRPVRTRVCLHVCAYTRWGWRGEEGTGGFCWMSHIVPVRPDDIAGGPSGMEPERVTVINSPFNNSCPTWPASPSQCPLCVYAYVYLCIHSMQEITTAGVQSLFFCMCLCV